MLILCELFFADANIFAHAMVHNHDVEEPSSKMHNIAKKGKLAFSQKSAKSTTNSKINSNSEIQFQCKHQLNQQC